MTSNIFRPFKFGKETFHPQSFDENSFVMNFSLEKGGAVPPHTHQHCDEHFKVVKGEMKFTMNGKTIMKKAGEELYVPKLTPHTQANAGNETAELVISFHPCADTHRLFQILSIIEPNQSISMTTMMKAMYIMDKLKMKQFSHPHPAMANSIIYSIVNIMGKLSGWDKLITKYSDTTNR
jgi:quercetin dioxygenase-like cupin family protein